MAKFTPGDLDKLYSLVVAECKKRTLPGQNLSKACPTLTFNDDAKKLIKAEDINEILKILQIIEQGDNTPDMNGKSISKGQKASQITITNAKEYVSMLSSYSDNVHNSNTGCSGSSCQGLCKGLCFGGCSGGCSSGCDGGCGGCKQNCASACSENCQTYCGGGCDSNNGSNCGNDGDCTGYCEGCNASCDNVCSWGCAHKCNGTCYQACTGCTGNCTATCQSNCSTHCGSNCQGVAGFSV